MLWMLIPPAMAGPTVWEAGEQPPYDSLQDAIAKSQPGDVIQIHGPEVRGSYLIDHALTLEPFPGETVTAIATDTPSTGPDPEDDGFVLISAGNKEPFTAVVRGLILEGNSTRRLVKVDGGATARLEGVTAQNGHHRVWGGCFQVNGEDSRLEVVDSTVTGCSAGVVSGAIHVSEGTSMLLANSVISNNQSVESAGAISCRGSCEIVDNTFSGNIAGTDAGALDLRFEGPNTVLRNRFCNNSAQEDGGALRAFDHFSGTVTFDWIGRNVFWGNEAGEDGGAIWSDVALLTHNNTFVGNAAQVNGAAVHGQNAQVQVVNSIVVNHEEAVGTFTRQGSGSVTVNRALVWDPDGLPDVPLTGPNVTSLAEPVVGNPTFVDSLLQGCIDADLHLQTGSPAIGQGDEAFSEDLGAFPCEPEIPGDGIDNDCDGTFHCFEDLDGDGYGSDNVVTNGNRACNGPGQAANATDCDDSDASTHPAASEVCDELDNDCDLSVDEDLPLATSWPDLDGDGAGAGEPRVDACVPATHVVEAGDCAPGDASIYPGAVEVCDGIDNDCDGVEAPRCIGVDGPGDNAGCNCSATSNGLATSGMGLALLCLGLVARRRQHPHASRRTTP